MPVTTFPLIGSYSNRNVLSSANTKDYRVRGGVFTLSQDPVSESQSAYLNKRAGWAVSGTSPAAGAEGSAIFASAKTGAIISAFGLIDSTIYDDLTDAGTIDGIAVHITEVVFNDTAYYMITAWPDGGWYLAEDAVSTVTFTADRTAASATLASVSSFTGLYVGQLLTGTGIDAGSRIASLNPSGSSLVMTLPATSGAGTPTTVTHEAVAKIIDSNFPTDITGPFMELDGTVYIMTADATSVYGSEINTVDVWSASNVFVCNKNTGIGVGLAKQGRNIIAFCNTWAEILYNAGNAFGSPLSRSDGSIDVGANRAAAALIGTLDDVVYFVSSNRVYEYKQGNLRKITSSFEETILTGTNIAVDNVSVFYQYGGMNVHLNMSSSPFDPSIGLMFLGATDKWIEPNFAFNSLISSYENSASVYAVSTSSSDGDVYVISTTEVFTDAGNAYSLVYQTQPYSLNDGEPFIIDNINLISDTQSSGSTLLESSADDYASFGTIGSFDLTKPQKNLPCGGYYDSSCAFRLTDSGNNAWRGQALKITWRPA